MSVKNLCKKAIIFIFLLAAMSPAFSDSQTLSTEISAVSNGISGFGMGLFPTGTTFRYYRNFAISDALKNQAQFSIQFDFGLNNVDLGSYDLETGTPQWAGADGGWLHEDADDYFRVHSTVNTYLQQGFGTNPVSGSGALVNVTLRFVSRFAKATEALDLTSPDDAIFNQPPFNDGSHIAAYPWLTGDRLVWNNYLALNTYWYFRDYKTNTDNYDGAYLELSLEMGPWWLGNDITPDGVVTSDYYKALAYFEQRMMLLNVKRENGWNWVNVQLGHSNSVGYTWGDVIPEHKIQTDRLRGYANDSIWLRFTGPQFIAGDCYPYIQFTLYNNVSYGGVQNEVSGKSFGLELKSGVSGEFHLRLFGFIHVRYQFGYDFIKGFDLEGPSWWQNAQLGFYVSL